jgi:hypothetical protein
MNLLLALAEDANPLAASTNPLSMQMLSFQYI